MKKIVTLMALLFVIIMVLAACSAKSPDPSSDGTGKSNGSTDNAGAAASDGAPVKALFIAIGNLGDKSFFDSANDGMNNIAAQLGCETKTIELGYDITKYEPALLEASEQDWDVIIVGTAQISEILEEVAAQFPEQKYMIFDASATGDNIFSIEYKKNEGAYLVGMAAAEFTVSGQEGTNDDSIIGTVGGMDIPVINDFIIGYIEGAKEVNPDVKVAISHIGNFDDTAKAKELAMAQISLGADVVFNLSAQAGLGIFDAAVDKGTYAIGVDTDQAMVLMETDPAKSEQILTSAMTDYGASLVYAMEKHLSGTLKYGITEILGIAEGSVTYAVNDIYNKLMPRDARDRIEQAKADIAAGKLVVPSAYEMTQEEIMDIRNGVNPN